MNRRQRDEYTEPMRNRLYRDRENGMIFGVCAGLADYFGFSVRLTRICVALGGLFFFPTVVVIYVILGLLLEVAPPATRGRPGEDPEFRRRVRSEPHATLRSVRHRYRELDRRLQRLEKYVTSKRYNLERELDGLRDWSMNPFEMVVAIVLLGVMASVITTFIKSRETRNEMNAGTNREAGELRDQISTLEERIRVLERIITDSNGREDLKRQFRDLER